MNRDYPWFNDVSLAEAASQFRRLITNLNSSLVNSMPYLRQLERTLERLDKAEEAKVFKEDFAAIISKTEKLAKEVSRLAPELGLFS